MMSLSPFLHLCYETGMKCNPFSIAAAAAAKSLQSSPTLCDPIDGITLGSPVPGILQARILEWVAISFSTQRGLYHDIYKVPVRHWH